MGAVEVLTVFWGDDWNDAAQSALIPKANAFFDFILNSALMDQLCEYSTGGNTIGHGRRTGTVTIPVQMSASLTDTDIEAFLQRQINAGVLPKTTGMTMRTARSATSAPGR